MKKNALIHVVNRGSADDCIKNLHGCLLFDLFIGTT